MSKCKNASKKKKDLIKFVLIVLCIVGVVFSYFHFYVSPLIVSANVATIKSGAVGIINQATSKTIASNDYEDLIDITKDNDGNVKLLKVNSGNVNKLNNNIMTSIQEVLDKQGVLDYKLPLGAFSGIAIFSGIGPKVNLKIVPIGNVATRYNSQIISLAINQSYHKIYLTITINISIILPFYTHNVSVSNQILVGENLIVGEIPSTYLNTENLTNALNLIP